jgi:hypothetical protein
MDSERRQEKSTVWPAESKFKKKDGYGAGSRESGVYQK